MTRRGVGFPIPSQDQDGFVMRFPACTVANGVFAQYGQITQVDAIYNCPDGAYGEIKFSALRSEQGASSARTRARTAAARSAATSAECGY